MVTLNIPTDTTWYIRLQGDHYGVVSGDVYDSMEPEEPKEMQVLPPFRSCDVDSNRLLSTQARRSLLNASKHQMESSNVCTRLHHDALSSVSPALSAGSNSTPENANAPLRKVMFVAGPLPEAEPQTIYSTVTALRTLAVVPKKYQ
ncbi:hypothetical protein CYMTET_4960 [Cymbomonas tetramitiformis]|uniref:Uncharacterized protein n=1 Tax=Cymbomonas tetramitiformis TaxID=36881 RepID=A0AAE0LJJ1_9CHLO|nr:hypothetical protein CYMTET_4960 [Cymbomonas tetramitiformis]